MKHLLTIFLIVAISQLSLAQTPEYSSLANKLDSIYEEDQQYRQKIRPVMEEYGRDSEELQDLFKTIVRVDSSNVDFVQKVLDTHGWLGAEAIGEKANQTLFLVIQHADPQTQLEYMPLMEEAVKKGNAMPQNFALLKDRVLLGQGKKQLYGSQVGVDQASGTYYVKPLQEPEKINKRRKQMGLGPVEDYVSRWKIEWSVEGYHENIEKFEKEE
jgi:hypothetical protein